MSDTRVMIIDDDLEFLEETMEMLEAAGYTVSTGSVVEGAEAAVEGFQPDLLLLDMKMNGNGKKLTSALRENGRTRQIHVVIISAFMDEESEKKFTEELGVEKIISKPVNPLDLIATIEELTHGGRRPLRADPLSGTRKTRRSIVTELNELIKSDDWRNEKHVPVIEAPEKVSSGEMFDVAVTIGKEVAHPNKTEHHISWVDLFFQKEQGKFPIHIGRAHFASHGASAEGPDTSEVYTHHRVVFSMKTDSPGVLLASSYCNIHGLWQSSKEIAVG